MTNIIDIQKQDHAELQRLMGNFRQASNEEAPAVFRAIVKLVTTHAFAEEEVLFPASRRAFRSGEPVTHDIEDKHQEINELLRSLEGQEPGNPDFDQKVDRLFALLIADLREEEDVLLPRLRDSVEEARLLELGRAFVIAKKAAPVRAHPDIPREPPGNVIAGIALYVVDRLRNLRARALNRSQ